MSASGDGSGQRSGFAASPEEIARSHRLRGLADMAGGMAHEFNQPLTVIRGCAENLLIARQRRWELPPERIDDKLSTIISQCDRISGLIDHVRTLARGAAELELAPTRPAESVADALRLSRVQLAARSIRIEVSNPQPELLAIANRHALAEILIELVRNARDAIASAGRSTGRIAIAISGDAAEVTVTVQDDGPGMSAEAIERACEPFRADRPNSNGPGLGLPIARRTMEAMGGRLSISAQADSGTTVMLHCRGIAGHV